MSESPTASSDLLLVFRNTDRFFIGSLHSDDATFSTAFGEQITLFRVLYFCPQSRRFFLQTYTKLIGFYFVVQVCLFLIFVTSKLSPSVFIDLLHF